LTHGDNLLALKALKQEFTGTDMCIVEHVLAGVKCCHIVHDVFCNTKD
jgi:hypothetical protein